MGVAEVRYNLAVTQPEPPEVSLESYKPIEQQALVERQQATEIQQNVAQFSIATQEDLDFGAELLKEIKREKNKLEDQRSEATKPLRKVLEVIYGWFRPSIDDLNRAESMLKKKIVDYQRLQLQRQQEALRAAGQASMRGDAHTAAAALRQASAAAIQKPESISFRQKWTYRVVDASLIPREYLMLVVNHDAIQAQVDLHKEKTSIPGIEVFAETSVASRRG